MVGSRDVASIGLSGLELPPPPSPPPTFVFPKWAQWLGPLSMNVQ